MDFRAQAAMDYLLTYGWAIVLIAVMSSVIFVLFGPPPIGVNCSSSDSKLPVQAFYILKGSPPSIRVLNGTGGTITALAASGGGANNSFTGAAIAVPASLDNDAVLTLNPVCDAACTNGASLDFNTSVTLRYTNQFGYDKNMKVNCQGMPQ